MDNGNEEMIAVSANLIELICRNALPVNLSDGNECTYSVCMCRD